MSLYRSAALISIVATVLLVLSQRSQSATSSLEISECVDAAGVSPHDTQTINQKLANLLTNSTFFSVFSVALDKPCPFWNDDDGQCVIRDCSVDSCRDDEVPPVWRSPCASPRAKDSLNDVDRSLTGLAALVGAPPCVAVDHTAWTNRDDDNDSMYVDLRRNPERYTGYAGNGAQRIWQAIYSENCFTFSAKCSSGICAPDTCKEERVLYRLISGLHASISMHIAKEYLFSSRWGINSDVYKYRLRPFPERIANLHVVYAVVLRAVAKATSALHPSKYVYRTGNDDNDDFTREKLDELFKLPILNPTCEQKVFDESDMFLRDNQHLLPEFRNAFRNISMIMDCVGCEKCRLWGKLQFLGLGTSMRILFEHSMPDLERNEVIALFNLLYKLSTSILLVNKMEASIKQEARMYAKAGSLIGVLIVCFIAVVVYRSSSKSCSLQKITTSKASDTQSITSTDSKISSKSKDASNYKLTDTSPQIQESLPTKNHATQEKSSLNGNEHIRKRKIARSD